ncbi:MULTISPECIES: UDP-3-O-acyl-N-acetylglucosamine deacetylase [Alteromonadaceae]|uniref:UDP-3-O-acyl-N-acetylglucosamine deacetylase n=1 Tax=Alteromonadaceae TaxID=72275 RepID=UPI001C086AE9|nr:MULTISPECIES: UDP-3-O-acyl-N-acetylglucosamine deacetylase [Aliiglaciecola]MBU2876643.1 UDP-3-O-acyl-N-acetylglucosamine deacetylase [Aliiglaciecola lipolytica]MDO6711422.1 UDP-3-O-acyl-N-acetylglucosamine deacetylase [Aliiglaciecola sp. 2_MG-2023]MDO6752601.1 UDP-3-O-acyl-N-acetylglucosamine deacetylase [Aliiglaciecola sp. 1_MG-2023]
MIKQRTIKHAVQETGIGLHKGEKVSMTLRPAPANTGIVFRRIDLEPHVDIPAKANAVGDTVLCTCLSNENGVSIYTVEHLSSALAGLGIDNIIVEVDSNELPIMDGSASPFIFLLQSAGIEELNAPKKFIRIIKHIRVEDGDKWAEFHPYDGFRVDFKIDFEHPVISQTRQHIVMDFDASSYVDQVSRARTFGFMRDFEYMNANNLALGGSMENAVALDEYRVLNPEGLRYQDEFLKHKILDAVGDLYLGAHSIVGELKAYKSGHGLNNKLLNAMLNDQTCWEYVTYENQDEVPIHFASAVLAN